jgi:hypothetical protein
LLGDEKSLNEFVSSMRDFNQAFCDAIASRVDFTIKLEVRGNQGVMLHAKVDTLRFRRPKGVEKIVEKRGRRKTA